MAPPSARVSAKSRTPCRSLEKRTHRRCPSKARSSVTFTISIIQHPLPQTRSNGSPRRPRSQLASNSARRCSIQRRTIRKTAGRKRAGDSLGAFDGDQGFVALVKHMDMRRRMLAPVYLHNRRRSRSSARTIKSVIQKAPQLPRPRRVLELAQGLGLDLADALAGDRELLADLFQRMVGVHADAEAHAKHALLARRQRRQHPGRALAQ